MAKSRYVDCDVSIMICQLRPWPSLKTYYGHIIIIIIVIIIIIIINRLIFIALPSGVHTI